ncbi:hypothetical protein DRE_06611 [Drechslerella stenobrocha 248]|uniref:SHSP domain-containing protein n=1 Tax=Drechslerella stenobrocha 248 TaxID=1043628 RepID=W7HX01_9PEZI|nr:hypothetical protein DRE_06611 [Drechslerella stenobrocha 248]
MPFVRFSPLADPFVDLLSAALAAEASTPTTKPASSECKQCSPARSHTRGCAPRVAHRVVKRVISPHFDVSETEDAYVLEGELPGVSSKAAAVTVDFDDAQTLVVRGEISRAKRSFHNKPAESATVEESTQPGELTEQALQASAAGAETVVYDDSASVASSTNQSKLHHATVEDDVDESETGSNASFEVIDEPTRTDKGKSKAADVEMTDAAEKPAVPTTTTTTIAAEKEKKGPAAKYWIVERPIGVFERRFKFQGLVDQDNVRANLENGLLTIVVPKRQAFVRSIFIQ